MTRLPLLAAALLVACADPAPPTPAPAKPMRAIAKPAASAPPLDGMILAEELRDADALIFVETSKRVSLERGEGEYAERMVLTMSPSEVVFSTPALVKDEPITVDVPYRAIMERMGGTPNARKTGLTKPNAHPTLPMGWVLKRDGEKWVARAALRGLLTDREGLKILAAGARGDGSPAAVLQRVLALSMSGAVGLSDALGQMFVKSLQGDPEGMKPAALAALCQPHADAAIATLRPGGWPDVHTFVLRHSTGETRKRAVKALLKRYDAEVERRPPLKRGQPPPDGVLIHGSTSLVLDALVHPEAQPPLYPVGDQDFKRANVMAPEILAAARAFAEAEEP